MVQVFLIAGLLLLLGDFLSTFFYHVPSHTHGKFHILIHHSPNRNYFHYAVLSRNPMVLLDGFLGVLPYFLVAVLLWSFSPWGVVLGLAFGQFHVWWRHVPALGWKTPTPIVWLCRIFFVTTPEEHWVHHDNAQIAYGDVFTFFDRPAQAWMRFLQRMFPKPARGQ